MILYEYVEVLITGANYDFWIRKGYSVPSYIDSRHRLKSFKRGAKLLVKIKDLSDVSNVRIAVKCTMCNKIRKVPYYKRSPLCWTCNLKNMKGVSHGRHNSEVKSSGADRTFDLYLRRQYNITIDQYYDMLEKQNYKCAICDKEQATDSRRLAVDHIHDTKVIRGLLCQSCNTAIGLLKDSFTIIMKAMQYVKYSGGKE